MSTPHRFDALQTMIRLMIAGILSLCSSVALSQTWYESAWPETDFSRMSVELKEIRSGGPPRDGIPPIDSPVFAPVSDVLDWIEPLEPVIAVELAGEARAYPLQILTYHEIVNDEFGSLPVSVTFCPLCNASIVFDRRVAGQVLDFGTTGLLRMSDLVMWDRQTESWWQQFSGTAIVGEMLGTELKRIPSSIVSMDSFTKAYPNGMVLTRDTGFDRPYGRNPYSGYDDINQRPFLFDRRVDERLPAMERVLSVTVDGANRIYPFTDLKSQKLVNDRFAGQPLVVFATGELLSVLDTSSISKARTVVEATAWSSLVEDRAEPLNFFLEGGDIRDRETGSTWNILGRAVSGALKGTQLNSLESGVHFAFAWLAFNPESEIYSASD